MTAHELDERMKRLSKAGPRRADIQPLPPIGDEEARNIERALQIRRDPFARLKYWLTGKWKS